MDGLLLAPEGPKECHLTGRCDSGQRAYGPLEPCMPATLESEAATGKVDGRYSEADRTAATNASMVTFPSSGVFTSRLLRRATA